MSFTAMLIGRTIYGVGAALNIIWSLMVIHRYFDSKELATSFAVSFSVGRMGFVANDFTAIHFIDDQSTDTLQVTVWCGVALLFVALLATFYLMDGHRWRFRLRPISCGIASAAPNTSESMNSMTSNHSQSAMLTLSPSDSGKSHLYSFRIGYWLLAVIGGLGFSLFSTWNVVANGVLSNRYGIHDEAERDWLLMIVYIVPLITAPLFGVILDKNGSFHLMLCFAGICGLIGHLVMKLDFELLSEWPSLSLLFLGFGAGMFNASLWPSIAFLCDEETLGTGYGLMMAFYAICYSVSEVVISELVQRERTPSMYDFVCFYLMALSVVYTVIAVILYFWKKDDEYRLTHYQSITALSRSQTLSSSFSDDKELSEGGDGDDIDDGVQETACTLLGVADSNANIPSLFSSELSEELEDGNYRGNRMSETMMGFVGENERVIIKQKKEGHQMNSQQDVIDIDQ